MNTEKLGAQMEAPANEAEVLELDELESMPQSAEEQEALQEAVLAEEKVPEQIAAVSAEIKDFKSPEEIKSEIKRLQSEYEEKKQAYQSFTHISSTDSGMGALGSFGTGQMSPAKLEAKFPGISEALGMIKKAEKKNSVGLKFWKNPELDDFQLQVIKNYLTTGSMGNFTNPKMETIAQETLNKFLEENKTPEANVSNVKQAIWGEHNSSYYEGAIADLNQQLTKMSEKQ
jgi:hypothetical protein